MNIISAGGADAVTIDGLNWTLLYPKVINQQAINAARVEAMMRKSNQTKSKDKTMEAIEYIETQHSLIWSINSLIC